MGTFISMENDISAEKFTKTCKKEEGVNWFQTGLNFYNE
jgi:hypothetical protein